MSLIVDSLCGSASNIAPEWEGIRGIDLRQVELLEVAVADFGHSR